MSRPPSDNHQDDATLIERTLDGDRKAFGVLVARYQDRLFNSMLQILRRQSDAEDVVQDAFVLAFTRLDSFQGNSRWYTWLYRIAYNVAINRMRRQKPTVPLDGKPAAGRLDFPDPGPPPSQRIEHQERADQLRVALDRLSVEHRSILVLREMDGLEYDAISEILDLPIGTVRSRLHRARAQLREHLEGMMHRR